MSAIALAQNLLPALFALLAFVEPSLALPAKTKTTKIKTSSSGFKIRKPKKKKKLSGGGIGGIVVAIVVVILLLLIIAFIMHKRKQKRLRAAGEQKTVDGGHGGHVDMGPGAGHHAGPPVYTETKPPPQAHYA